MNIEIRISIFIIVVEVAAETEGIGQRGQIALGASDYARGAELEGLTLPGVNKHRRRPVGKYIPIKNRVGIELRPPEADGSRFGDWEMDLMSDSEGKNFKLTLVERSTLFSIIRNLHNGKVAIEVAKTVVDALLPFKRGGGVKTITTDNGTEFYEHEYITRKLGAPVYFTNPYCSWQKGCIENTNMLYRQYLPRDRSFAL